jgi:hypothetical protein
VRDKGQNGKQGKTGQSGQEGEGGEGMRKLFWKYIRAKAITRSTTRIEQTRIRWQWTKRFGTNEAN